LKKDGGLFEKDGGLFACTWAQAQVEKMARFFKVN